MACNTPFDVCSICGNKAHTRQEYCTHLTTQLNTLYPDGRKVMALNLGPLKFFDISIVIRPADVTSSVLEKVANHQGVISSVEAALADGVEYQDRQVTPPVGIKKEAVEKLADLIKQVDGEVVGANERLDPILDSIIDPDDDIIEVIHDYPFVEVLNAFAELGMNPSMTFWSKFFAKKYLGKAHLGDLAMAVADHVGPAGLPIDLDNIPEIEEKDASPMLLKLLVRYIEVSSYRSDMVEKRASRYDIGKPGVPTGYTNWELGRLPPSKMEIPQEAGESSSFLNTLLTIAGSALVAKMLVSGLVERKLKKEGTWLKMPVATAIVKSAEVTVKLMEDSIKRHCRRLK